MHAWLSWIWRTGVQALQGLGNHQASDQLSDFTTTRRVLLLSTMAIVIGLFSAFVALALLSLIGLFTNLFFFQRLEISLASPASHTLGLLEVFVPVVGALIIGCMARYGSERMKSWFVREVMRTNIAAFPATISLQELSQSLTGDHSRRSQR